MRILTCVLSLFIASGVLAQTDAADQAFIDQLDVKTLKPISIQHNQTLKTLDSFARQALTMITARGSYKGQPAVYTVLDMSFRPEMYRDLNIIKVKNTVLRQDFQLLKHIDQAEKDRIIKEGTISLSFWNDERVQELMGQLTANAVFKAQAVGQVQDAAMALQSLGGPDMHTFHVFPPAGVSKDDHIWKCLPDLFASAGASPHGPMMGNPHGELLTSTTRPAMAAPTLSAAGYEGRLPALEKSAVAMKQLSEAWRKRDVATVNQSIAELATNLPVVTPSLYPSAAKRKAEVVYNGLAQLTKPGIMLYLAALLLFLLSARSGMASLRIWGLRVMVVAFIVHTGGIAIRWWLVEKSVGNWFESIPIKNQFESVMFSVWFGTLIGLLLEMRKPRGLFGAAAAFVGVASMVALLTVPYFYRDIGGEIGQVQGVLMSYWLYIHVTMVVASYALIGMGFLLSIWWLWGYYKEYGTFKRIKNPIKLSADAVKSYDVMPSGGGGVARVGWSNVLMQILFLTRPQPAEAPVRRIAIDDEAPQFQAELDACNLVILHLIFWILGVGIILGAVWADMSWGRPWGWDPKETFALVTWIVYLIMIHVRVIAADKAWWTAVLSVIGFFVMLFNWIGVNFFLTGLHSYAG